MTQVHLVPFEFDGLSRPNWYHALPKWVRRFVPQTKNAVLNDEEIFELIEKGVIENASLDCINPSSLDLRLDSTIKVMIQGAGNREALIMPSGEIQVHYAPKAEFIPVDLRRHSKKRPASLSPDTRFLAASMETFNLPPNICALVRCKSSAARSFYEHLDAGWCDPGWHGSQLTMEFVNHSLGSLPIYPEQRLVQMIFFRCKPPAKGYHLTGRYNGDQGATEAKHEPTKT